MTRGDFPVAKGRYTSAAAEAHDRWSCDRIAHGLFHPYELEKHFVAHIVATDGGCVNLLDLNDYAKIRRYHVV